MKITPSPGPIVHAGPDGPVRYEHDVEVDVPEALGLHFVLAGWAKCDRSTVSDDGLALLPTEPVVASAEPVDLEVQNVVQTTGTETQ